MARWWVSQATTDLKRERERKAGCCSETRAAAGITIMPKQDHFWKCHWASGFCVFSLKCPDNYFGTTSYLNVSLQLNSNSILFCPGKYVFGLYEYIYIYIYVFLYIPLWYTMHIGIYVCNMQTHRHAKNFFKLNYHFLIGRLDRLLHFFPLSFSENQVLLEK